MLERADNERRDELTALVEAAGVRAGQIVALSLGAPPEFVQQVSEAVLGGEDR